MTPSGDPNDELIYRLIEELSLSDDEAVLERCRQRVAELQADPGQQISVRTTAADSRQSNDPHGALLAVYEQPRQTSADGPLSGTTVVIKDNIAVEGLEMTLGLASMSFVPNFDAVAVERLLNSGATVHGKANMDAFAYGPSGEFSERRDVMNPTYEGRVPGGTSSGSAAAVAAGLADAALGTDTGGSIRKPAAYCGLVGVKTTHSLVPRHGLADLVPSLDTIGPIAPDVATATQLLDALAGHDPRDPTSSHVETPSYTANLDDIGAVTVGVPPAFVNCAVEPIRDAVRDLASDLDHHENVEVQDVDVDNAVSESIYPHIVGAEAAWVLRQRGSVRGHGTWYNESWFSAYKQLFDKPFNAHITERMLPGAYIDSATGGRSYVRARQEAVEFRQHLGEVFEAVDLLLTPTVPVFPPRLDADTDPPVHQGKNTRPFNLARTPAVAVPIGERRGLPVSVQVVAPQFQDRRALKGARLIERTVG
jgi:aspartyl-tRNA(Asn)/glutamyl-tRNA(Gln) amidotransferase subunit A